MARIRSIHPGLFTDEAFAMLSSDAQVFLIGIWTEADDRGVFEWKPVTLRMRLRPSKDGDVTHLLDELTAVNSVKRFTVDGRSYGAIRNFRKWQRPEKPKIRHPLPDELLEFVGFEATSRQPVADQSPKVSAEEGGRREEEGESLSAAPPLPRDPFEDADAALRKIPGIEKHPVFADAVIAPIWQLVQQGYDLKTQIIPSIRKQTAKKKNGNLIGNWHYFVPGILQDCKAVDAVPPAVPDEKWRRLLGYGRKDKIWDVQNYGPMPGQPGCRAPPELLNPGDGDGWGEWKASA